MTPLIDRIEAAFVKGREDWYTDDSVSPHALFDLLAQYGIGEPDAEDAMVRAFLTVKARWGTAQWVWQSTDVAEEICQQLVLSGAMQTHWSQPC